jgi:hypothetical protein
VRRRRAGVCSNSRSPACSAGASLGRAPKEPPPAGIAHDQRPLTRTETFVSRH